MPVQKELIVSEVIQRTYNVISVRLRDDDEIDFIPGQYMLVTLDSKNDRIEDVRRALSISNSPTEKGYLEFTKKLTGSRFCQLLSQLKVGEYIRVAYPFGSFTYKGEHDKLAFLAGGIGITPIRSICKYIVDRGLQTDVVLIYANQTVKDIVFKQDFDLMQRMHPSFKVFYVLFDDTDCDLDVFKGLINKRIIERCVPDLINRKFYISGPPSMVDAMKKILINDLSILIENLVTEKFGGYV